MTDPRPVALTDDGHPHDHAPARPMSRHAVRLAVFVLAGAAALTLAAMIWLWPDRATPPNTQTAQNPPRVTGEVVAVHPQACAQLPDQPEQPTDSIARAQVCGTVTVRLGNGRQISTDIPAGPGAAKVGAGDGVVLLYTPDSPEGQQYQILDHQRTTQLWLIGLAFALAVIAFARWRGLAALAGLAITFGVLLWFIVPAILDGRPPLAVAIVGSAAIMLTVLYLTHGFRPAISVAVLGTLASLGLTGLLASATTTALHLTGVASEEDTFLTVSNQSVNMKGLLLAGMLIGSLGVLDDVTVTQAVTVGEVARANPTLSVLQLYRAGARVGRAHITSVINTIVLAYAGASLPLLLLIAAGNQPIGEVITSQLITQEIARSAVGTLGLIAAVPITTALAALVTRHTSSDRRFLPVRSKPSRRRIPAWRDGEPSFAAHTRKYGWIDNANGTPPDAAGPQSQH